MNSFRLHFVVFYVLTNSFLFVHTALAQAISTLPGKSPKSSVNEQNWNYSLRETQLFFIENKGQVDEKQISGDTKFTVSLDGVNIYFSPSGITYTHIKYPKLSHEEREEMEKESAASAKNGSRVKKSPFPNPILLQAEMQFVGANTKTEIIGTDVATNYFTYSNLKDNTGKSSIKARAFKKITYKNVYPNIDIEYVFPEGKTGLKYSIILHPGADPSQIKMVYNGDKPYIDKDGNAIINTPLGNLTDHAPTTVDHNGNKINSSFLLTGNVLSFNLRNYNTEKTVIIDPWTVLPTFTGTAKAYDIDWDYVGNIYVYGGQHPYQLSKLTSSGILQWTYTCSAFTSGSHNYADFAIDRNSGTTYMSEGFNQNPGARILKVNAAGTQVAMFPGISTIDEMWRIAFNSCTNQGVIGCGNTGNTFQAASFDSSLTVVNPVNVMAATTTFIDICTLTMDDTHSYMINTLNGSTVTQNDIIKCTLPSLASTNYMVNSGYNIEEIYSIQYTNSNT